MTLLDNNVYISWYVQTLTHHMVIDAVARILHYAVCHEQETDILDQTADQTGGFMAFVARYPGICIKCHNTITKGQAIAWSRFRGIDRKSVV